MASNAFGGIVPTLFAPVIVASSPAKPKRATTMRILLKKQLSILVVASGFAALEASIATMSATVRLRQSGFPTGAAAEPGTTRTQAMRRPHSGVLDTTTQTPSVETVLWTTGRFRVAATPDLGEES